jgi:hypothetical protein
MVFPNIIFVLGIDGMMEWNKCLSLSGNVLLVMTTEDVFAVVGRQIHSPSSFFSISLVHFCLLGVCFESCSDSESRKHFASASRRIRERERAVFKSSCCRNNILSLK